MPARQHGDVMDAAPCDLPFDLAAAIDDRQLVIPLDEQAVLSVRDAGAARDEKHKDGKNKRASAHGSLSSGVQRERGRASVAVFRTVTVLA